MPRKGDDDDGTDQPGRPPSSPYKAKPTFPTTGLGMTVISDHSRTSQESGNISNDTRAATSTPTPTVGTTTASIGMTDQEIKDRERNRLRISTPSGDVADGAASSQMDANAVGATAISSPLPPTKKLLQANQQSQGRAAMAGSTNFPTATANVSRQNPGVVAVEGMESTSNNNDNENNDATFPDENSETSIMVPLEATLARDEEEVAAEILNQVNKVIEQQVAAQVREQQERTITVQAVQVRNDEENPSNRTNNTDHNEDGTDDGKRSRKLWIFLCIGIVFIGGAVVGLAVALGGDDNGNNGTEDVPIPEPTESPTLEITAITDKPTSSPTANPPPTFPPTSPRFEALASLIGDMVSSNDDQSVFRDTSTPQYRAFSWLADDDATILDFSSVPQQILVERYVLALLYDVLNGNGWIQQYNFLKQGPVCGWTAVDPVNSQSMGVICEGPWVKQLILFENGLIGSLPTELGLLTNLDYKLDLRGNAIFGTIPTQLGQLTRLERFWMGDNEFTGSVPTELGKMSSLFSLEFYDCVITGTVPTQLAGLMDLKILNLSNNKMEGSIPTELGNLESLTHFALYSNMFDGSLPSEIGRLTQLTELAVMFNQLTGSIPTELAELTNLIAMFLSENAFEGTIPTELAALTLLKTLTMQGLNLSGTLDPLFCVGSQAFQFELFYSDCLGANPDVVCTCCTVCCDSTGVNCEFNTFDGTTTRFTQLLEKICLEVAGPNLSALEDPTTVQYRALNWLANQDPAQLDITITPSRILIERYVIVLLYYVTGGTSWTNQNGFFSAESICEWNAFDAVSENNLGVFCTNSPWVTEIDLAENGLVGTLPTEIGLLNFLSKKLSAKSNSLYGTIPTEVGVLSRLEAIGLDGNTMDGIIPTELGRLTQLTSLDLELNIFTGTIPTELGTLTDMLFIALNDNSFTGTIPTEIGFMSNLSLGLSLSRNFLTGTLPRQFSSFTNLELFYASANIISGTILSDIGLLTGLQKLSLWDNDLTGTIPTGIGSLKELEIMSLDENRFSGTMPTEIGNLSLLNSLNFAQTNLVGTIPTEVGRLTLLERITMNENEMTGSIPSELGNLTSLTLLWLQGNLLTGTIPTELTNLRFLTNLALFGNFLIGNVDPIFCDEFRAAFDYFYTDCQGTTPEIVCTCCTHCCDPQGGDCVDNI